MAKPSKTLWVRMDPADHEAAIQLARRFGVSVADLVRVLVKQAVRVDVRAPGGALLPGLYLPDPETDEGAAEIDDLGDQVEEDDNGDPGPVPATE